MAIDVEIVELLINGKTLRVEVPANVFNMVGELEEEDVKPSYALYTPISELVTSIVRALLPLHWRPPTQRQLSYATTISTRLGIRLPENALRDTTVCSAFISENEEAAAEEQANRRNKRAF